MVTPEGYFATVEENAGLRVTRYWKHYAWDCLAPRANGFTGAVYRCRKCATCLKHRRRVLFAQSMREVQFAPKAWFVTITVSPQWYGHPDVYGEMQKWLKRLRSRTQAPVRYVVTLEKGSKSGRKHYHLLVLGNVTERDIRSPIRLGISEARLLSPGTDEDRGSSVRRAVWYVVSYVAKDAMKARHSLNWGIGFDWRSNRIDKSIPF